MTRIQFAATLAILLGLSACFKTTTVPSAPRPLTLALAGQSNAGYIRKFLEERATVVGYAWVTTIRPCWDVDGTCWLQLRKELRPDVDAFVWWQGDVEIDHPSYTEPLSDLVRRVRAQTRNPRLPVVILQLGPVNGDDPEGAGAQARRWAQRDPYGIYVETRDKEYQADRQHMTEQGYRDVSDRIVTTIRARLGRR
jgi:hypothetical protein